MLAAAELVDDLASMQRREDRAYRYGFVDGWDSGLIVGAQKAERDLTALWDAQDEDVRRIAAQPSYAALELRRWGPGGREHFGDPRPGDFPGMGADYQPPQYYVPLHPGRASRHHPQNAGGEA